MRLLRRRFLQLAGCAAALPAASRTTWAQAWPSKPIKLVVAFPAGGPADTMGRLVGQAMSSALGQSVIVENIGGAGGTIALRAVAGANPDGYTLLVNSCGPFCTAQLLYTLDFDPTKLFTPVATFASDSGILVAGPAVPAKTLAEFIQYAKANPGKLYSGSSIGTNQYLMAERFKTQAHVNIPHVPYRGGAPAIADLLGGQIHMVVNNKSVLLQLALDHKVTPLAVTSTTRWPELPDVPTMQESGITDVPADIWYAIFAPPNTPEEIVVRLNRAINDGMNAPETRTAVGRLGVDIKLGTPAQAAAVVAADCPVWLETAKLTKPK